ncbi:hypothetical protein Ahy_B03g066036 isoform B [Arachis hypogaea]|uniref:Peptidase S8/S53 domain-containing protein n=1 Tax=Arachis hypogaea TaxID=3818 RepID=A0A445A2X3_ARAHY|nr:hypothetical protein Ahy_B03g066036 isoform B [Arachis hypogaea]
MDLIEENANTLEQETDGYLVDESDDEDEDEEDEIEESDEDEESRNDGEARTPDETGKGYNLRVDPPRRSASRYTSSMFKKAAKKCKNLVKDINIGYNISDIIMYESTEHLRRHLHQLTDGIYYDCVPQPHIAYIAWDDVTFACPYHSRSTSSWGDLWQPRTALIYSENSGTCIGSKSKTRMKDGSSHGTSFASAIASSVTFGAMMPSP